MAFKKKLDEKLIRQFQSIDNAVDKLSKMDLNHITVEELVALGFDKGINKEDLDYIRNNPEKYSLSAEADEKRVEEALKKLESSVDEQLKEVRKKLSD